MHEKRAEKKHSPQDRIAYLRVNLFKGEHRQNQPEERNSAESV